MMKSEKHIRVAMIAPYPLVAGFPEQVAARGAFDHPASWVRALALGLTRQTDIRFRIFVLRRGISHHLVTTRPGYEVEYIPQPWPARLDIPSFYLIKTILLYRFIRRYHPNLVHGFGFETGNALIAGILPWPRTAFVQGIVEYLGRHLLGEGRVRFSLRLFCERWAATKLHGVVAESNWAADWARRRARRARIALIPHAVNPEFLDAEPARVHRNPASFVFVGTLLFRKGVDLLIQVARTVPQATFVVIGDGPDRSAFESLAAREEVSARVHFVGCLSFSEIVTRLRNARGLVLPSRFETAPNVVSEAHAVGLPVVAFRVGGIPDLVVHGEDGLLAEPGDVSAMSQFIRTLTESPTIAATMGAKGRAKVQRLNSPDAVAQAHVQFFRDVLRTVSQQRRDWQTAA